jgi:hypothetical protein
MGRKKTDEASTTSLSTNRASRLYRLLSLTAETPRTRKVLLSRLKIDLRGFYRDLEFLRSLGIEVSLTSDRYQLLGELDAALSLLPFPDPCLSIRDVLQLAKGNSEVHQKLRRRFDSVFGNSSATPSTRSPDGLIP